ncbi:MAG: hypothetical protein KGQ77_04935, partial [Betaproteobacteria bacterium]|nr:hypothetical protein [Betaproteobacteria bacterium]
AGNRFAAVNGRPLPAATWRAVEQAPARQMPLPAYRGGLPPAAQAAAPRGPEGPAPSNAQRVMPAPQGNPAFNGARPEQHYPNVPERAYTPQQRIAPPPEVQRGYAPPMPAPQERGNFAPQRMAPPMPAQQERGYAPPQRMAQQPLPPTPQRAAAPPERQFNRQAPRPEQRVAPHGGEQPRGEPHPRNEPQRLNER